MTAKPLPLEFDLKACRLPGKKTVKKKYEDKYHKRFGPQTLSQRRAYSRVIDAYLAGEEINERNIDEWLSRMAIDETLKNASHNPNLHLPEDISLQLVVDHAQDSNRRVLYGPNRAFKYFQLLDKRGGVAYQPGSTDHIFARAVAAEAARTMGKTTEEVLDIYEQIGAIMQQRILDGHPCGIPYIGTLAVYRSVFPPECIERIIKTKKDRVDYFKKVLKNTPLDHPDRRKYVITLRRAVSGLLHMFSSQARVETKPCLYFTPRQRSIYMSNCKWYATPYAVFAMAKLKYRTDKRAEKRSQRDAKHAQLPRLHNARFLSKKYFMTEDGLLRIPEERNNEFLLDYQCSGYDRTVSPLLNRNARAQIVHKRVRARLAAEELEKKKG